MPISINDLDIDNLVDVTPEEQPTTIVVDDDSTVVNEPDDEQDTSVDKDEDGQTVETDGQPEPSNVVEALLKQRGIEDPSKIKFVDDNNEVKEVDWDSLSIEEQLNILQNNESQSDESYDLDDDEIDLINRLRLGNVTPQEYISIIKQQGVAEYLASQANNQQQPYMIDDLTDEELYVLDLQARVGADNITEDELQEALDRAKSNEALFAKEIAGLREEYHRLEDDKNQKDAALAQYQAQENFNNYANGVINAINGFNSLGELNIDMDDNDKNEIYQFLTDTDQAGVSYLQKALSDPDTLVQMAWFALKGEDVINSISDYYKTEITKAHRAGYDEGYKKASAKENKKAEPKVVVKKPESQEVKKYKSIEEIDW